MCFSLNFDVTKLHHISMVKLNLFQNALDNKAGIFRFKTVFSTQTPDIGVLIY